MKTLGPERDGGRKALRVLQTAKKLSQNKFADFLGISPTYLSLFYSGKRTFGGKTALRISALTEIPMEELYR